MRSTDAHLPILSWLLVAGGVLGCAGSSVATPVVVVPDAAEARAKAPPDVEYCAYLIDRRGTPECAAPIDAETARHRETTTIIRRRDGRPVRVELVNGSGQQFDNFSGASAWDLTYAGDQVVSEKAFSSTGRFVEVIVHSADGLRVDYQDPRGRPRLHDGAHYTSELRELDSGGLTISRRHLDADGAPTVNGVGVHELRFRYDARGVTLEITEFDSQRAPTLNKERFHRMTYERDALGNPLVERHFDVSGAPVETSFGAHEYRMRFDRWGNGVDARFFAVDGTPTIDARSGARWTATYDEQGNRLTTSFFGVDGLPIAGPDLWATTRRRFDERGRIVEWARSGADGLPIGPIPILRVRYDERGRIAEDAMFDASAHPRTNRYAFIRYGHDAHDNVIEKLYFDAAHEPVDSGDGSFGERRTYDDQDRLVETAYLDAAGQPVNIRGGYAYLRYRYDAHGTQLPGEQITADGAPLVLFGAQHLMVMYSGARRAAAGITRTRAEALARAEEARQKVLAGMSFDDAVIMYSDEPGSAARKGDLGRFKRGVMVPEFEHALEALPLDGTSDAPVETPFGFHIIHRTH